MIGKRLYHTGLNPRELPSRGRVIDYRVLNPQRRGAVIITIKTDMGEIITDYENHFSARRPAICNFWS